MGIILFRLTTSMLLPVLLAAVFYLIEKRGLFGRLSQNSQQVIIGISFGILAILSTEFGIPIEGATINVRDAAPMVAGLIFGWPAGILAGLIGGVERWFAALWGAGEFTRLACTLATILAGFMGAAVRRFMMDNKRTSWFYGLAVGVTAEVFHMLLVFETNMDDLGRAFSVVQKCALPMILANGISVMLAIIVVFQLSGKREKDRQEGKKIAQTFQRGLLICVAGAFVATSIFTHYFQTRLSRTISDNTLSLNLQDVCNEIQDTSDGHLLDLTDQIARALPEQVSNEILANLALSYDVAEINLVNEAGVITMSTNPDFIGYDMSGGEQSSAFMPLLEGTQQIVQNYQPTTYDPSISRKYAGVALARGGFLQVGYDAARFQRDISEQVVSAAKNRRIGRDGCIIISDEQGTIISDRDGHEGEKVGILGSTDQQSGIRQGVCFDAEIYGADSFCMYTKTEGYFIIAVLPKSEGLFHRDVSVYILAFMEILVFAAFFANIYFLIKKLIVDNIQKINSSLAQITQGDLDVTVDVRSNEEFASLSDDINSTVVTLKHYIDEAAARIDQELEFAKQIQHSSLPSVFPPYPNRKDFSIYASMDTAKEVGGDFYDFYLLDADHLAFLIADVSGKGIPAAMFMMTAKTLIKGLAESGIEVNEVFTRANAKLCEGNDAGMFVTAWMGILDLKTGLLKYADAGHNPPVLRRAGGEYEYLKIRPNFILAGMEGMKYRLNELQLAPGDEIFLYTDGVTEAQNSEKQLYGEKRLLQSLNEKSGLTVEEICAKVKKDVDAFVGEADQFDDMTMLCVHLTRPDDSVSLKVVPTKESIGQVADFVRAELEKAEVPAKYANKLNIAVDEIYSNIVYYSGAKHAEVRLKAENDSLTLIFKDDGTPYNPLETKEPDITASAAERPIGGLGIFMVRKMMDDVAYTYEDGWNVVTLTLVLPH